MLLKLGEREHLYVCVSVAKTDNSVVGSIELTLFFSWNTSTVLWNKQPKWRETFHISCRIFHGDLWKLILPLCHEIWNENKSTSFLISGTLFFSEPFYFQNVLWELSHFGLSFPINDGESEGGSWSQWYSKWFVNQRLKEEMRYHIGTKERKKEKTNFIEHLLCA